VTEPTTGYTVAAADVTPGDVLEALTAGHEAATYREAIARDGLAAVAERELRDLIDAGHLLATEDAAEAQAGDVIDRDPFADPQVLAITAEDVADHLVRLGWNEPAPAPLFDPPSA
jgi:hypothetical protein